MLRIVGDCWRVLLHRYRSFLFRRKWERAVKTATKINSIEGLYLTVCDSESRTRVVASVERTWPRIPVAIRRDLQEQWKVLQRRWDQRQVGIRLHLPIFGVFREFYADKGTLLGMATVASLRGGYTDSVDSTMKMFDLLFLPLWTSDLSLPDDLLDVQVARVLASYHLCEKQRTPALSLLCGCHDGTDELVAGWGFSIDAYHGWYEQRVNGSTQS